MEPTKPKTSIWTNIVAGINLAIGVLALTFSLIYSLGTIENNVHIQTPLLLISLIITFSHLFIFFSLFMYTKRLLTIGLFANILVLILYLGIIFYLWFIYVHPVTPPCNKDIVAFDQIQGFCPQYIPFADPRPLLTIIFTTVAVFSSLSLLSVWKNLRKFSFNKAA